MTARRAVAAISFDLDGTLLDTVPDLAAAARRAREQLAINPDNALTNYQAHRAFIWSGDLASAKRSLEVIRSSSMAADSKLLAEIRQACAEGRSADARMLGTRMDAVGTAASRWHAAKILGDDAGARRLLEPFDDAAGFSRLVQFLLQPNFDPREFPAFAGRLEVEGVSVAKAIITPGRCKP